jgi:hypothetical protein
MVDLDTRLLRAFVTVAEEPNRVRISHAGARYLRGHRHAKLLVRVTLTPNSGPPIHMGTTVRIT